MFTVDVERHADTSEDRKRKRVKDRADRATVEQVNYRKKSVGKIAISRISSLKKGF